ncbi:FHA domain-containing protein [Roseiconus nitratireducens]
MDLAPGMFSIARAAGTTNFSKPSPRHLSTCGCRKGAIGSLQLVGPNAISQDARHHRSADNTMNRETRHDGPCLSEITHLHQCKIIPLPIGTTYFGRKPSNNVLLDKSPSIGSHIARIVRSADESWIEDVGARNPPFIDGVPLRDRKLLRDGTEIRFGAYVFQYCDET